MKLKTCEHQWNFIDKWKEKKGVYYEFFCDKCLKIKTIERLN